MNTNDIIAKLFKLALDGKIMVYTTSKFDRKHTDLDGKNDPRLSDVDAAPLIAEGLLYHNTSGTLYYRLTPLGLQRGIALTNYKPPLSIPKLLAWVSDRALFHPADAIDGRVAVPLLHSPGAESARLVLVLGENAGGKSLFRRMIRMGTHRGKEASFEEPEIQPGPHPVQEMIHLSMQGRTSGGFASSCVYGEESYRSTGENSAQTVEGSFNTIAGRAHTTILYWDEPDVGMSNRAAAGTGLAIREFIQALDTRSPLTQAVFLTSHNPVLVRQFIDLQPHYIHLGDPEGPKTLDEWFVRQQDPTPLRPKELTDLAHQRFRDIQAVLDGSRKKEKS